MKNGNVYDEDGNVIGSIMSETQMREQYKFTPNADAIKTRNRIIDKLVADGIAPLKPGEPLPDTTIEQGGPRHGRTNQSSTPSRNRDGAS